MCSIEKHDGFDDDYDSMLCSGSGRPEQRPVTDGERQAWQTAAKQ